MQLTDYSIDDLHQLALAEFELDTAAQNLLHSVYEAQQKNYIAALMLLRLRRQQVPPWNSATS